VVATSFSVPAASLAFWRRRLTDQGVAFRDVATRFGEDAIHVADPSGLWFELIGNDRDTRAPWIGNGVGPADAIRGLHSVTLNVRSPGPTLDVMTGLLGYRVVDEASDRTRLSVGGDGPGHTIDVVASPDAPPAVNGIGTVHHVAMAIATDDEQLRLRQELLRMGLKVTEVRDRCYFNSIYFREPGGVLFEVATSQPGFATDEDPSSLGRGLKLPPWEEPYRSSIEAKLPAIEYR
jgi:glyoxalase family protein